MFEQSRLNMYDIPGLIPDRQLTYSRLYDILGLIPDCHNNIFMGLVSDSRLTYSQNNSVFTKLIHETRQLESLPANWSSCIESFIKAHRQRPVKIQGIP